ncbi:MAG TPA: hypothetical protein DCS19_05065 [Flavobacterium sp.]|nr:hypothetical protein [Flavobacterium sp.]
MTNIQNFFEEGGTGGSGGNQQNHNVHHGNGDNKQINVIGDVRVVRSIGDCERECDGLRAELKSMQEKVVLQEKIINLLEKKQ